MSPEQWAHVANVFSLASRLPQADHDSAIVRLCSDDPAVQAEVRSLLSSYCQAEEELFLKYPVAVLSDSPPLPDLKPGFSTQDYDIVDRIGQGGMGIVYHAWQRSVGRDVALKIVRSDCASNITWSAPAAEAGVAGILSHPYVATVYTAGVLDIEQREFPFFAMEYVQGQPLDDYVRSHSPSTRDVLALVQHIAEGVGHAHAHNVVHCDLKPRNVLVTSSGWPKVLDFGVARILTPDSRVMLLRMTRSPVGGTRDYMSPEQLQGRQDSVGCFSDVYSLGVILHELLTESPPPHVARTARTVGDSRTRTYRATPVCALATLLDNDLNAIVTKALGTDPATRYPQASAFAEDIRRYLAGEPLEARRPWTRRYVSRMFVRRNRMLVGILCLLFMALSGGLGVSIWHMLVAQRQERIATAQRLAAQANASALGYSERRLIVAVEATAATKKDGICLPVAEESLRDALAARPGYGLGGHSARVTALAFSRDAKWLATASKDGTIRLWNMTVPDVPLLGSVLRSHNEGVRTTSWSCDGRWLAAEGEQGQRSTIHLWPLVAGSVSQQAITLSGSPLLGGTADPMSAVLISPDGRWLAAIARTGEVCLWRMPDATLPTPPTLLGERLHFASSIAISPNSSLLAAGSRDGIISLWNLAEAGVSGQPVEWAAHEGRISALAFTADGRQLITGDQHGLGDEGTICMWSIAQPHSDPKRRVLPGTRGYLTTVVCSADGQWLVTGRKGGIAELWKLAIPDAPPQARTLEGCVDVTSAAISIDSRWLATGSLDRTVRLWDLTPPEGGTRAFVLRHDSPVVSVAISPDNHWLAGGGGEIGDSHGMVRLWDLTRQRPDDSGVVLRGFHHDISDLAVSPDGRWLVSGGGAIIGGHSEAYLWDITAPESPQMRASLTGHESLVTAVAFARDCRWLVTGSQDRTARLWHLSESGVSGEARVLRGHTGGVLCVALSGDGHWLATGSGDSTVRLWDLRVAHVGTVFYVLKYSKGEAVRAVAFSRDGNWLLASGGFDVRMWDVSTGTPSSTARIVCEHEDRVGSLAISVDSRWLVAGTDWRAAWLWDLKATSPSQSGNVLPGQEGVTRVLISSDGHRLITGGARGTVRLWDLQANNPSQTGVTLPGHCRLGALAVSADGRWLSTGSGNPYYDTDCDIRLWDLQAQPAATASVRVRGHTAPVVAASFTPDSRWLVSAGSDRTIRLWPIKVHDLISQARRGAGRNLTKREWDEYFPDAAYRSTFPDLPPGE